MMKANASAAVRLSAMMFVQYLLMPVWLLPLLPYLGMLGFSSEWIFAFGLLSGIGTFASPLVCLFADRFLNAERVLALCNLVTAGALGASFFTTSPVALFLLLLLALVAYMPTWSITSAIAMTHASPEAFPRYRTLGSLGWVASGLFSVVAAKVFGMGDFDLSRAIFLAGAGVGLAGAALALLLPPTEPKARGTKMSLSEAFGLKAFSLFRDGRFAVFAVLLFLAMIPFQWYMVYNPVYLVESGFRYITMTQNVGQVAEIVFLLCVPWIVRRFGYRVAFTSGFGFLALRYAFFYLAARNGLPAGVFGGILVHGMIFGLVVVVGQMYVGEFAPPELRNQAQGLIILLTSGLGLFVSNLVMHPIVAATADAAGHHDWTVPFLVSFVTALVLTVASAVFFKPKPKWQLQNLGRDGLRPVRGRDRARPSQTETEVLQLPPKGEGRSCGIL